MFVVVTKSSANCCTNQLCPIIADIDSGDDPEHGVIKRTSFVYRLANYKKSIAKAISSQKKKQEIIDATSLFVMLSEFLYISQYRPRYRLLNMCVKFCEDLNVYQSLRERAVALLL